MGNSPVLCVAEPELIKQILVKDFDIFPNRNMAVSAQHKILNKTIVEALPEDWRRIRTISTPAFTSARMKKMYPMIKECYLNFLPAIEESVKNGKEINLVKVYGNFSMSVIAKCAFATQINVKLGDKDPFVKNGHWLAEMSLMKLAALQLLPKFVLKFLNLKTIYSEKASQFFFDLTRLIIAKRRNTEDKFDDFIQLMINAEKNLKDAKEEGDIFESHHGNEGECLNLIKS